MTEISRALISMCFFLTSLQVNEPSDGSLSLPEAEEAAEAAVLCRSPAGNLSGADW